MSNLYQIIFENPLYEAKELSVNEVDYTIDLLDSLVDKLDEKRSRIHSFIEDKTSKIGDESVRKEVATKFLKQASEHFRKMVDDFMEENGMSKLGEGDYRVVYSLGDDMVVKVFLPDEYAKLQDEETSPRVNDNESEVKKYLQFTEIRDFVPKLYGYDEENYSWALWEKITPKKVNPLNAILMDVGQQLEILGEEFRPKNIERVFMTNLEKWFSKNIKANDFYKLRSIKAIGNLHSLVKRKYDLFKKTYDKLKGFMKELGFDYEKIEKYALQFSLTRLQSISNAFGSFSRQDAFIKNKDKIDTLAKAVDYTYFDLMFCIMLASNLYEAFVTIWMSPKTMGGYTLDIHEGNIMIDERTERPIIIDFGQQYIRF